MAPDPVTQERIYRAIKADFLAGNMRPGVRLEIQAIADYHRASTTPVREVLHRLLGERLIQQRHEGGFRITLPDEGELSQLYIWNLHVLLAAIRLANSNALKEAVLPYRRARTSVDAISTALLTGSLFGSIGTATKNAEFTAQIESISERLHYIRLAEASCLDGTHTELQALASNGTIDFKGALARRVKRYHMRRIDRRFDIAFAAQESPR